MENWKTILGILTAAVAFAAWLLHGGLEEVDDAANRARQKLSCWYFRFSLWKDTERIRCSYRYITCGKCGYRNRIDKEKGRSICICASCNHEINQKKKGKRV